MYGYILQLCPTRNATFILKHDYVALRVGQTPIGL